MILEHAAIWTNDLDKLKGYYEKFYGAKAGNKYRNEFTGFESYFLSFESGARLEIMQRPGIPRNLNDTVQEQYIGIIHLAFSVATRTEVDEKAIELSGSGYTILRGPRLTGDGYYEFETLDPDGNRLEVFS
jgi:lactoylglutathione lyase